MIIAQSLYMTLKTMYPYTIIDVLAPNWSSPILERMSEVNQIIQMPIKHSSLQISSRWKLGRQLAKNNYTHAYILPNSAKSALVPLFAGIKNE
ncbi:ADP-heptose--LPS heptosyltransferase 2 [Candidatus Photodesmus katoptron Akat1]|uniref:ADP-heptose--LPS heptosyltransferase 2 n=1 Tax=Candidatus Photodesmus katoptron Akat1 TaxID=1236703 RepID=S3DLE3_9GAMM|nr:ADP-heptose--LPS heptosyltransferase 2 [Candidatus Photodesmus katoptron Akat1]